MNSGLSRTMFRFMEQRYLEEHLRLLLDACLAEREPRAFTAFVEGLIFEGPRHLPVLVSGLAEVRRRRQQVLDDLGHLWREFLRSWRALALPPFPEHSPHHLLRWNPRRLEQWLETHNTDCAQLQEGQRMLANVQSLYRDALKTLHLLDELEAYLQDWLWGMTYQALQDPLFAAGRPSPWHNDL